MIKRLVALVVIALAMAGCDVASSIKEGMEKSGSAATAIEKRAGTKPEIGFNIHNGNLTTVTVQFSTVPVAPVPELERIVREEVKRAFQAEPSNLVIAFIFKSAA